MTDCRSLRPCHHSLLSLGLSVGALWKWLWSQRHWALLSFLIKESSPKGHIPAKSPPTRQPTTERRCPPPAAHSLRAQHTCKSAPALQAKQQPGTVHWHKGRTDRYNHLCRLLLDHLDHPQNVHCACVVELARFPEPCGSVCHWDCASLVGCWGTRAEVCTLNSKTIVAFNARVRQHSWLQILPFQAS